MSAYAGSASGASSGKPPDNTVTLIVGTSFNGSHIVGGQAFGGWETIRISRSLDRMPSDFDISLTEKYPGQASQVVVTPGSSCQVLIGKDTVITGYIDRYMPSFSARSHQVRISGRSKCEDLVDCSITPTSLHGMTMTTSSLLELAQALAKPYGITASSLTGDNVPVSALNLPGVPLTFQAILTEAPYEILERVSRYVGVLVYDGTDGNLLIANVGTSTMASGFSQGGNVENASVAYTMDQRYSIYLPYLMSTNFFNTEGIGGVPYQPAVDKGVTRLRELIIVSEQFGTSATLGARRAQWEAARRVGRSQAVHLTCDSWRDQAGTLWAPNAFAPINLPTLKLTTVAPWVIGDVTYRRDGDGTHADLVLMPKEAFQPQPEIFGSFPYNVGAPPAAGGGAQLPPQDGVS